MKNILYAIILSFLIHLLFFFTYESKNQIPKAKEAQKVVKKHSVRYVKLKKKIEVKKKIKKDIKKPIQNIFDKTKTKKTDELKKYKKVIKKQIKKAPRRKPIKKPKKIVPKPKTKTIVKPTFTQPIPKKPNIIKKQKTILPRKNRSLDSASKKLQDKTLESFLLTPNINKDLVDDITQGYIDLYGEEFKNFTSVQKVFLKDHLKDIGLITQGYMHYPDVSIRTRQEGTNILEFMLYPNGDISEVKLRTSSGYTALDKSSLSTIQIAYIDYPKPKTPTKIIIYMSYIYY